MTRQALALGLILFVGCAHAPRSLGLNDLQGEWKGQFTCSRRDSHMSRWISAAGLAVFVGCAHAPRPLSLDDLQGDWKGEWIWKSNSGGTSHSGAAQLSISRMQDPKKWILDLSLEKSALPGGKLVIPFNQLSDSELTAEYQGGTGSLKIDSKGPSEASLAVSLELPGMGSATGKGSWTGSILRLEYSESMTNGTGTVTLERVK